MQFTISPYPSSYLTVTFEIGEQIITEKGCMIACDGAYTFTNKVEARSYKNWLAKIFGGKSLTYNVYTANEKLRMMLSPKDSAEIFAIDVLEKKPILFEPHLHFAHTTSIELTLEKKDWKSTLHDGLKLRSNGTGQLFLKGYGIIIEQCIDTDKPIYVGPTEKRQVIVFSTG